MKKYRITLNIDEGSKDEEKVSKFLEDSKLKFKKEEIKYIEELDNWEETLLKACDKFNKKLGIIIISNYDIDYNSDEICFYREGNPRTYDDDLIDFLYNEKGSEYIYDKLYSIDENELREHVKDRKWFSGKIVHVYSDDD